MVLPYLIYLIVFFLVPLIYLIYLTFTKYTGFNSPVWVGLDNWRDVLSGEALKLALRNTLTLAMFFVPLQTLSALLLAIMMTKTTTTTKALRTMYFLPVVVPWVAGTIIFQQIFLPGQGLASNFMSLFGMGDIQWHFSKNWIVVIFTLAIINTWKGTGQSMVIFLAGLQNISKDVVEASQIDGVTVFQQFRYITWPLISPITYLVLVLSTIAAFQIFDLVHLMLSSAVTGTIHVMNTLIYWSGFDRLNFGVAAVNTCVLIAIVGMLNIVYRVFEKKWVHYE